MDQNINKRQQEIENMSRDELEVFMNQKNNIHHSSDGFALDILEYKKNGYYVEMGSGDPISGNTTYKMESEYDWTGVGFELNPEKVDQYNSVRKNKVLMEDATKFDYLAYFKENNYPKQIDYLQIDIESPIDYRGRSLEPIGQPLNGLISLPLNQYRFSVICFEHDTILHYKNASMRDAQREILNNLGYSLVVKLGHEDWWVDPTVVPYPVYKYYGKHDAP
jgi:hypothetical protein